MKRLLSALLGSALCLSMMASPVQAVSNFKISQSFQYYTYWEYKNTKADLVMSSSTAYHNHMSLFAIEKSSVIETAEIPQIGVTWLFSFKSNPNLTKVTLPSDYDLTQLQMASNPNLTALLVPGNSTYDTSDNKWFSTTVTNRASNCPNLVVYGVPGTGAETFAAHCGVAFMDIALYGTAQAAPPEIPLWGQEAVAEMQAYIMPELTAYNCEEDADRGLTAQSLFHLAGNGGWPSQENPFIDGGDYGTAIAWCQEKGIMNGKTEQWFDANGAVTREEFALILAKVAEFQGLTTEKGDVSALGDYGDAWDIADWAKDGMAWVVANGLMMGSNGNLNPKGQITQTEVAVMLSAYLKL